MLSNTVVLLLLVVAVSLISKGLNEKPPLIRLSEKESFRFDTGSYVLTPQFRSALDGKIALIEGQIQRYGIDTVEVIGHTDGQPAPGASNVDRFLPSAKKGPLPSGIQAGSNTDLGLLRALAVANYLRTRLKATPTPIRFQAFSASSLLNLEGDLAPADAASQPARRRIELRFTRHG
jgi:outer membrane protein OmpA-like peptidoglycan-associated protein